MARWLKWVKYGGCIGNLQGGGVWCWWCSVARGELSGVEAHVLVAQLIHNEQGLGLSTEVAYASGL